MYFLHPLSLHQQGVQGVCIYLAADFKGENTQQRIKISYLTHTNPHAVFRETETNDSCKATFWFLAKSHEDQDSSRVTQESKCYTCLQDAGNDIHLNFSNAFNPDSHNILVSKLENDYQCGWTTVRVKTGLMSVLRGSWLISHNLPEGQ